MTIKIIMIILLILDYGVLFYGLTTLKSAPQPPLPFHVVGAGRGLIEVKINICKHKYIINTAKPAIIIDNLQY